MKNIILWIMVLLVAVINSCNRSDTTEIVSFSSVKNIQFHEYELPVMIGLPGDLVIVNNRIIMLDLMGDWFFLALDKEFEMRGRFIRRGHGPEEEVFIFPYFKQHEDNALLFQSLNYVNIALWDSKDSDQMAELVFQYELPASLRDNGDFVKVDDYLISSLNANNVMHDFIRICTQTDEYEEWGGKLPLLSDVNNQNRPSQQKLTTFHSDDMLLATVYHMLPVLRITCARTGSLLNELKMAEISPDEKMLLEGLDLGPGHERKGYYQRIKSTHDYVYALYAGAPLAKLRRGGGHALVDLSNEIHVWMWDGTPVAKLELSRPVFSFDVTPDNKRIIATSVENVEKIFVADIPWE